MSVSYRDAVASFFRGYPNTWIDGMELSRIAGCYAWRTRISECRTQLGMDIENVVRVVPNTHRKVSLYRYRPASLLEMVS